MSKVDNLGARGANPNILKPNSSLPKSLRDQQNLKNADAGKAPAKSVGKDYSVDLSSQSKELEKSFKQKLDTNAPELNAPKSDIPKPVNDLASQEAAKEAMKEAAKTAKVIEKKYGTVEEPGIFFISGFDWMGASSVKGNYDGIPELSQAVEYAHHYTWDQKDEILEEIKMRKTSQPIVLVGHSFGGDTAMEIAQELNSPEFKFRTVDLLVTLDSVGADNDRVPENVRFNLNYVADDSILPFLNDGPHLAKNYQQTKVENLLRPEKHAELDDLPEVQKNILKAIDQAVSGNKEIQKA